MGNRLFGDVIPRTRGYGYSALASVLAVCGLSSVQMFVFAASAHAERIPLVCETGLDGSGAPFQPFCQKLTDRRLADTEFFVPDPEVFPNWQDRYFATWYGPQGIFIVPIQAGTGWILMGQRRVVDYPTPVHPSLTAQGPEFALSARGLEVYYNCISEDETRAELCRISLESEDLPVTRVPESRNRILRNNTFNVEFPQPNLYTAVSFPSLPEDLELRDRVVFWRADTETPTENRVDANGWVSHARWMPDGKHLVYIRDVPAFNVSDQLAIFDTQSGETTPVVIPDLISRRYTGRVFAWFAPDMGGRMAIVATRWKSEGGTAMEVYVQDAIGEPDETGWSLWAAVAPPDADAFPYITDLKPFVVNGNSFVTATSVVSPTDDQTIAWVAQVRRGAPIVPGLDSNAWIISPGEQGQLTAKASVEPYVVLDADGNAVDARVFYFDDQPDD